VRSANCSMTSTNSIRNCFFGKQEIAINSPNYLKYLRNK
jgi:hypothetical protein